MSVDVAQAMRYRFEPAVTHYTERDVSLYALSIGAAADPMDADELKFVYELNQGGHAVFPTFAVTFPFTVTHQIGSVPGLRFNPMMLLHGEQYLELKRPLAPAATLTNRARIAHIFDKGKGALVVLDIASEDEDGNIVAFNRNSLFIRGIGGFGGERGPANPANEPPAHEPDASHSARTRTNQALLYRLASGDRNPLHADPAMAAVAGFERPILHGLCTFGFAARAVLKHFGDDDPARFKSMQVRFSRHVFPGDTLITDMWQVSPSRIVFQTRVAERDVVVLNNGALDLSTVS